MSLFKKLFIFSCITLCFIILPLFYIAKSALTQFGTYACDVNEKQIRRSSRFYLSAIAEERAKTYNEIFQKISMAAGLMGTSLTRIYHLNDQTGMGRPFAMKQNSDTGLYFSPPHEPVIKIFWGADRITPAVKNEIHTLNLYAPILVKAKENIPESLAAHVITTSGIGCYYTVDARAKAACFNLPSSSEFDMRNGEPVTMFSESDTRHYDTRWTRIYKDDVIDDLMMTASAPVYDAQKKFRGITGIDLPVGYIIRDVIGDSTSLGVSGSSILFSFLLNRDGKIIAFPEDYLNLIGLDIDMAEFKNSGDILMSSLKDSAHASVRNMADTLIQSHGGVIEVKVGQNTYWMGIGCLTSVGWHLICVAKESDLTESLDKTGIALEKSLTTIWKDFIGHSVLILILSLLLIYSAIKVFVSPIRLFIAATKKISRGDFSIKIDTKRDDEIGQLERSFSLMIEKLQISERKEKEHARDLEKRIKLRTAELEKSNKQLNQVKNSLEKTIAKRTGQLRKLNEHLVFTEESERKAIASDLHDSVTQTLAMCISKLKDIREMEDSRADKHLKEVQIFLEQSVREIRSLIYQLSPPTLDDFDIEIALGFLIEEINLKHHSHFTYFNHIDDAVSVDHAIKVTIYRAVSELIFNILKHAGTKKGEISISYGKEEISLFISDKGVGFDVNAIQNQETFGFGLKSLSERIQNFGGSARIDSCSGVGTDIYLTVPVRMNKETKI